LNFVWGKSVARVRVLLALGLLTAGAVALCLTSPRLTNANSSPASAPLSTFSPVPSHSSQAVQTGYGKLPLAFEPNRGQTDRRVKFLARGSGFGLFLTGQEAVLKMAGSSSPFRMTLAGGNANAQVIGSDALPGKSNYLIGNNPSRWHTNIPQYARVRYSQAYPGVDLVYYGKQGQLEYDFEVAPGADPGQVTLEFQGTDKLSLEGNGDLLLAIDGGKMRLGAPRVYQIAGGERRVVDGKFVLQGNRQVGFEIGAYDRSRTLVIDPVLTYSTYLGGSGSEFSPSVAVDSGKNAYVAGTTASADFPVVASSTTVSGFQNCQNDSAQPTPAVGSCPAATPFKDVFIAKFDASGSVLLFSTYLGGGDDDSAGGVAVDSGLNVVVAGTTRSNDFPVMNAFQSAQGSAGQHVFVTKLDPAGQHLVYSTYLHGSVSETATGVAVDSRNRIYVTGTTMSKDFPVTTDAFQATSKAATQFFVSKIDTTKSAASTLVYSTYFGGSVPSGGTAVGGGIAVDTNSAIYFTGTTNFQHTGGDPTTDFPILNAFQSCLDGPTNPAPCPTNLTNTDAFVAKLDPSKPIGSHLIYSTYLGGTGNDSGTGISVVSGNAYVTGTTDSADVPLPTSTTPFQECLGTPANPTGGATCPTVAGNDAYLAKLSTFDTGTNTTGTLTLQYFTYIGGGGNDQGLAVAADSTSIAHVTGSTDSGDFHVLNALPGFGTPAGGTDAFVTLIDTTDTTGTRHSSSYLGGSGTDRGTGIAVDTNSATYVVGETSSGNFPTVNPFQGTLNSSSQDAFVSKLGPKVTLQMTASATPNPVGAGSPVTFTFTITNNGDTVPAMTLVNNVPATTVATLGALPSGCSGATPTVTCGLPLLAGGGATQTITFTLTPAAGTTGFSDSANIIAPGTASAGTSVVVNDFNLSLAPNSATVVAGQAATYNATVSPSAATGFPNAVSLACSGLPTGATCSVANGSITNLNSGPQSRAIVVNTTMRTTTTVELRKHGPIFAMWLPVSGLAFLGFGIGGAMSRKRRAALGLLIGSFFVLMFLQVGCGSSSSSTTTTTGTPAGTYTFTVTATSGSASRTQIATITVQ
jgi:hypothetical protein